MNNDQSEGTPSGELAIQAIAMPADANVYGDIFGGWLVSQMDLAASVLATKTCHGRAATVAIQSMVFHKPVQVGNLLSCYAEIEKIGTSSMTINIEAWTINRTNGVPTKVTEGTFVFVAIDENGRPRPVNT